jgi:hypothetical protein
MGGQRFCTFSAALRMISDVKLQVVHRSRQRARAGYVYRARFAARASCAVQVAQYTPVCERIARRSQRLCHWHHQCIVPLATSLFERAVLLQNYLSGTNHAAARERVSRRIPKELTCAH